jgi:putative transposase
MANLFVQVLRDYMLAGKFVVHDFVVMPNHIHLLLTVPADTTIEKVVQLIKGNFSFRASREANFHGEVWQRGFSDVQISDEASFRTHQEYINANPISAGLAISCDKYPHCSAYLKLQKQTLPTNPSPLRN